MRWRLVQITHELDHDAPRQKGARIELSAAVDSLVLAGFWLGGEYG